MIGVKDLQSEVVTYTTTMLLTIMFLDTAIMIPIVREVPDEPLIQSFLRSLYD